MFSLMPVVPIRPTGTDLLVVRWCVTIGVDNGGRPRGVEGGGVYQEFPRQVAFCRVVGGGRVRRRGVYGA